MAQNPHGVHHRGSPQAMWARGMKPGEPSMVERAGGSLHFDRPPVIPGTRQVPDAFFRVEGFVPIDPGGQSQPLPFKWPRGGTVVEMVVSPLGVLGVDGLVAAMSSLALRITIADARESITLNATPGSSSDDFILFSSLCGFHAERICYLERPVWDQLTWQVTCVNKSPGEIAFTPEVSFSFVSDPPGVRRTSYRRVCVAPGTEIEVLGDDARILRV